MGLSLSTLIGEKVQLTMTLDFSSPINSNFSLLSFFPYNLQGRIIQTSQKHYEELYEAGSEQSVSLEESLSEILELFRENDQKLSHIRYVWMALILVIAVEPTIRYYQPNNQITESVIDYLTIWLFNNVERVSQNKQPISSKEIDNKIQDIGNINNLFSESKPMASFQILSEALSVYQSAIKTLNYDQSLEALLDILENCLEGYAIFPGSEGRRKLFNWWLTDVILASWYLQTPSCFYFLQDLENGDEIEKKQITKLNLIVNALNDVQKSRFLRYNQIPLECLNYWRNWKIFSDDDIARMKEVKLTSEPIMMMIEGKLLSGDEDKLMDSFYKKYYKSLPKKDKIYDDFHQTMSNII